jgi:hypothetical protein
MAMVLAGLLLLAIAIGIFVSPLIAVILFVVGAVLFLLLYGFSATTDEAGPDQSARSARRGRRQARPGNYRNP